MLVVSLTRAAHAEPTAADVTTAKSLVVEGRELRAKGKHSAARDRFKAAWALVPTPIIGMDLAREHEALGELVESRETAIAVTKLPPSSKESDEAKSARADAVKLANDLAARIPGLVITVESLPTGAVVTLDGREIPSATLGVPLKLNPGSHRVALRLGDKERAKTVALGEGEEKKVALDSSGLESSSSTTASSPSGTTSTASAAEGGRPTLAWVGLGVAGAGAIVGAVGGFTAWSGARAFNDANAECDCLPLGINDPRCTGSGDLRSRMDDGKSKQRTGFVILGIGGAMVIGGLVTFALAPNETKRVATGVTSVAIGFDGFWVGGRF